MTLEEKLHEQFDWLTVKHVDASNAIKEIVALHQQEIDEACKKAKIEENQYWQRHPQTKYGYYGLLENRIKELSPKESE